MIISIICWSNNVFIESGLVSVCSLTSDLIVWTNHGPFASYAAEVADKKPSIVVLDLNLGMTKVLEAIAGISRIRPETGVVVLGHKESDLRTLGYLRVGARAVLSKADTAERAFECFRAVAGGRFWLPNSQKNQGILANFTS